MTDHFEFSMYEDYEVFEDAEDGLNYDPPDSGPLLPPGGGYLTVSSSPGPKSTPPSVGDSTELVTVINLSDDDSPPYRPPAHTQQPSRKHQKSRACLLQFCSQRVMGNGMAAAVKHFSFAHLPQGPEWWTIALGSLTASALCWALMCTRS
jgi:hypothetical protein